MRQNNMGRNQRNNIAGRIPAKETSDKRKGNTKKYT